MIAKLNLKEIFYGSTVTNKEAENPSRAYTQVKMTVSDIKKKMRWFKIFCRKNISKHAIFVSSYILL